MPWKTRVWRQIQMVFENFSLNDKPAPSLFEMEDEDEVMMDFIEI